MLCTFQYQYLYLITVRYLKNGNPVGTKSDNPTSIPMTYTIEGENLLLQVEFGIPHFATAHVYSHVHTHACTDKCNNFLKAWL